MEPTSSMMPSSAARARKARNATSSSSLRACSSSLPGRRSSSDVISGVATRLAPAAAASRIRADASATLAATSVPERIWMQATVRWDMALAPAGEARPGPAPGSGHAREHLVDDARDLALERERQHAHHRIAEQPGHQVEAHHEEEPGDEQGNHRFHEEARRHGPEQAEDGIRRPYEESHEEERGVLGQEEVHCRAPDQRPHDHPE